AGATRERRGAIQRCRGPWARAGRCDPLTEGDARHLSHRAVNAPGPIDRADSAAFARDHDELLRDLPTPAILTLAGASDPRKPVAAAPMVKSRAVQRKQVSG